MVSWFDKLKHQLDHVMLCDGTGRHEESLVMACGDMNKLNASRVYDLKPINVIRYFYYLFKY